jgi:hypothetical protein
MAWGFDRGREQDWSLKTPVHLMQEAAVVLMQGGGFEVYNVPTRSGYIIPAIIDQVAPVADFCRERQALSHKSLTVPQVALLNSETSLWDRMDRLFSAAGELDELEGALQALLDLHYSVDILAEHQIISRLNDFPLVVIPDSHKLAPDFQQALIRYVENGGSLLLLGENCARLFESLLGVRLIGEPEKTAAELATPLGPVSVGGIWQTVEPAAADSAGLRYPTRDFRRDSETAATIATRGRGKIAAVYGPVALAFFRGHHPGLRLFIGELVSRIFADPLVKIDASPALDIALRRTSDGRLSLHLLNRSAFPVPDRYNFIDSVPSVGPVKVSLKLEARPKNVLWLPSGQAVSWVYENGRLQANIPSVHIHGILLVD